MRTAVLEVAAVTILLGCSAPSGKVSGPHVPATHGHRPPAAGLAYRHARVFDAPNRRWLLDHTVLVRGDAIAAVGPTSSTPIPPGAEVVDLAGKSLLPGLIDTHAHLSPWSGVLHIASGVTTIRELGNDEAYVDDRRARFDAGTAIGPHVVRYVRIEGVGPKTIRANVKATTEAEGVAAVDRFAARGYAGVKIYGGVDPAIVPAIVERAHAKGMRVTGHVPAGMIANDAIAAGFDGIEHINMLALAIAGTRETDTRDLSRFTVVGERGGELDLASPAIRALIAQLRERRVVVTPTFAILERLFVGEPGQIATGQRHLVERLPEEVQRKHARGRIDLDASKAPAYRAAWARMLALGKLLHDEGVLLAIGSDSTAGLMLFRELELFVEAGVPAADALAIATIGNARAIGVDAVTGSIEVGKRADLVVVDGDPIANIRDIARVVSVMRAGRIFASTPLYESVGVRPP